METWNREELYAEVWEKPLVKAAPKYGISDVALAKVCRKLQIPLPGRGYWTKKECGKPVEQPPLPEAKDLPVLYRQESSVGKNASDFASPEPPPTDPEFARIVAMESRTIVVDSGAKRHKLVTAAEHILKHAHTDEKRILQVPSHQLCLDLRVSERALDRALALMNAVILSLEGEGFPVTVEEEKNRHGTAAKIFGQKIQFAIVEKLREKGRREIKEYSWTRKIIDSEPTGLLEFRIGDFSIGRKFRDSNKRRLEAQLSACIGAMMRDARYAMIREIKWEKERRERAELAQQIAEEEQRVRQLETWVASWARAQQMREFIAALEKVWKEAGHDLSPETPKGKRIVWMKQQADRIDPMVPSAPSVLDRK